jgi:hypothetical protein
VILLAGPGDDPIEGTIEASHRHQVPGVADYYTYDIRYSYYEKQLHEGVTRDQLFVEA